MSESSIVYVTEASAGSGKTYCLANHYLKLLLAAEGGAPIEQILAITFTNKASREMRERILEFLKIAALKTPSDAQQPKAMALMDYIIANYNFFQVKTIDSFINMILLGCAYRLGLSANFEIRDDFKDYLVYSLDECIDRSRHDKSMYNALCNFLHQYIYLEERNSWFPKKDILGILESLFYYTNIYGRAFKKMDLKGIDVLKEKKSLLTDMQSFVQQLPEGCNKIFLKTISNFTQKNKNGFDFSDIAGKQTFKHEEIPFQKGKAGPPKLQKKWEGIRQAIVRICEAEAFSLFNCYIDIFEPVYQAFRRISSKEDVLFLEELNQQARGLIHENGVTVPELYYRLATRLRHFLIDEFQDTSLLQWRNIFPMIEETISTGGSLFYVGDRKQAIFGFRGGDASLFNQIKHQFNPYVKTEFLNTNYRSRKEIVEFNNSVFSQENLENFLLRQDLIQKNDLKKFSEEDRKDILGIFAGARQEYLKDAGHEQGLVQVELVQCLGQEEKEESIKEKLLPLIKELNQRMALKDISLLCRDNMAVELVSGWLIENNIAVESEKTLNIKNNRQIKELAAFLNFLNSPIDNLSFASFILGDIFIKATGMAREDIEDFLFVLKERYRKEQVYIYREFKKAFPAVWDNYLETFFKEIGFIGLYELTVDILHRFQVLQNFPGQQGFFMHFLELIKDNEEEHQGIADFLEFLNELDDFRLYVNSADSDAVKVTTIHKSKGLGYSAVIMPFLEMDIAKLAPSYALGSDDDGLMLLGLNTKYAEISPHIQEVYRHEYKKAFIDELNVLYVAFTRAINELYLFIPQMMSRSNNTAGLLIPGDCFKRGSTRQYPTASSSKDVTSLVITPVSYTGWIGFLKEEFADLKAVKNRRNIQRGKILHEILSFVGNLIQEDKEEALVKAFGYVAGRYSGIEDLGELEKTARRLLDASGTGEFFSVPDAEVYREKEVVDSFGATKRIDRLIVKKKEVWVVDYKSKGESALDFQEQLEGYKSIIKELYPERKIRCFVIFLEEAKVEELDG